MPPKTKKEESGTDSGVNALIHLLAYQEDLRINSDELATVLGLNGPKNLFRKLNQVLEPYNFKFDRGKVVPMNVSANTDGIAATGPSNNAITNTSAAAAKKGKDSAPSTPVRTKAIATNNKSTDIAEKSTKSNKEAVSTPGHKKSSTTLATVSAKKRGAEETTSLEAGAMTKKQATIKEKGKEKSVGIELGGTANEDTEQQSSGGDRADDGSGGSLELEGEAKQA